MKKKYLKPAGCERAVPVQGCDAGVKIPEKTNFAFLCKKRRVGYRTAGKTVYLGTDHDCLERECDHYRKELHL